MFELTPHQNPQIPRYVDLNASIPGYSGMTPQEKDHYEGLYVLACHPELLNQPPEDIRDLHALIYFVFQYNLANPIVNGRRIHILPFIPVKWSSASGLLMGMTSGHYASLLDRLSVLQESKTLYFALLLLSLILIRSAIPEELNYRLLFTIINVALDNRYTQGVSTGLQEHKSDLTEPWLVEYLPKEDIRIDKTDPNILSVRGYLLGNMTTRGIFPSPRIVNQQEESEEQSEIDQKSTFLSVMSRCIIS